MAEQFQAQEAYAVFLRIQAPMVQSRDPFVVQLLDLQGNVGSGTYRHDPARRFGSAPKQPWDAFLERYTQDDVTEDQFKAFGRDLFQALIIDTQLGPVWTGIQSAAAGRPLLMTVELERATEAISSLPLELLHSDSGFLFARPGSGIQRTLLQTPAQSFFIAPSPRVLLAWACPAFAGAAFDPQPHIDALQAIYAERLTVLPDASLETLEAALDAADASGTPYDYVHLLAHGYRGDYAGGICLVGPQGGPGRRRSPAPGGQAEGTRYPLGVSLFVSIRGSGRSGIFRSRPAIVGHGRR